MKIVTFNIRCDCEPETLNAFQNRKKYIQDRILKENADIIGFQEMLPHMAAWLQEALPSYYVLSCGREQHFDGEAMTIAFHRDRFNLLGYRTFWLSDAENVPGSRFAEQSVWPRICSVADLQARENGRCFTLFNTHLDHEYESARLKGIQKVLKAAEGNPFPVLLTGDFNAHPDDDVMAAVEAARIPLTDVTADVGATFHDYGKTEEKIDYIYVGKEFCCTGVKKWTDCHEGVFLSDHYPVCAEIEWKEA